MLLILISIFAGAKVFHVLLNYEYYLKDPKELLSFDFSGFALYGSFLLSCLSGYLFSRWVKVSPWSLADSLVPAIGIGVAVARVGCFLNGCCFGKPASLFAGIAYPPGSPAQIDQMSKSLTSLFSNSLPVFPSQLFEVAGALIGVVISYFFYSNKFKEGSAFLFFAAFFSLIRMINYFLRQYPSFYSMPSWFYPLFYSSVIMVCIALFFKRKSILAA